MSGLSTIPAIEPSNLIAGDTLTFRKALTAFPASVWTLTYYLLGDNKYSFTATADGDTHVIEVASTTTDDWVAGIYKWEAYASITGERYLAAAGSIIIKSNPAAATYVAKDNKSHVKRVLEAIEAVIEGRASRADLSYSIQGRSIQHISPAELIKWYSFYKQQYQNELAGEKASNGLGTGHRIITRFV